MKQSHFKKSSAERERLLMWASAVRRNVVVLRGSQRSFWSKSIKNSSHSVTSCYIPSLCDSVVFRSFLTSICLSLFGSGDRSTCSTLWLPWKYPGLLGTLEMDDSCVFLFLPRRAFLHTSHTSTVMCTEAINKHTHATAGVLWLFASSLFPDD